MRLPIASLIVLASVAAADTSSWVFWELWSYHSGQASSLGLSKFTSLVTFGDSYTDDSRLNYFSLHNGDAPPVGWVDPANYHAADGGRVWPQYVAQYADVNIYNYAVSGAVCSNNITPRWLGTINASFPSVAEYEVPAYLADSHHVLLDGKKFLDDDASSTVYSIWIGVNDLGVDAFLTDSQVNGTKLVDYTDCVLGQLSRLYQNGARYFVLQNLPPLQLSPLYGLPGRGGLAASSYWPTKPGNITEISYKMLEYTSTCNAIFKYETPYMVEVVKKFPGAHFAVMDINGLMTDIHNNPSQYLNGTAPLNVTGYATECNASGQDCVGLSSPDSYMWFDPLHPTEQVERVVARTFVDVVTGSSKWATYWSG